jgi:8-oxo-dGTP diphosphatase
MQLIKEITEKELSDKRDRSEINYDFREAARAVLFDQDNQVALVHAPNKNYYKLPGGGVEEDESVEQALKREVLEEAGCEIEVIGEVGQIVEHRDYCDLRQASYCFLARVVGEKGETNFTQKEKERGFKLIWVDLNEAIHLVKGHQPELLVRQGIKERDLEFLLKTKRIIKEGINKPNLPL